MASPPKEPLSARREGPINKWFGDSSAAYLVLSRLSLQEMPLEWQARLVALLDEAHTEHGLPTPPPKLEVKRRDIQGKIVSDPWANYRHGTSKEAKATERALGLTKDDETK